MWMVGHLDAAASSMTGITARLHEPPRALRAHVAHIWELSGSWLQGADLLLPDTSIDISVHLHGEAEIYVAGRWSVLPARAVVGSLSHAMPLRHARPLHAFGIRLPPGDARLLLLPAASLRDVICPLAQVAPGLDRTLAAIAAGIAAGRLGIHCVWQALGRAVRTETSNAVQRAALQLAGDRGRSIAALARELGISRRHLSRRFRTIIGWTPEEFRRLARFSAAAALAASAPVKRWSDIAIAAGYFDQAHFVRDFRSFASQTPSAVFSAAWFSNFSR